MLPKFSLLLLAALPFAMADVKVTVPAPAASYPGTAALALTFADGSGQPPLAQLSGFKVTLLAGGNDPSNSMTVATGAVSGTGGSLVLDPTKGPSDAPANAFYLRVESTPASGSSTVVNYSQRFTLTGMTGTWQSAAMKQAATAAGANPANVPKVSNAGSGSGNAGGAANQGDAHPSGTWPAYSMQSGTIKFAPMQGKPGTSITQTNTSPLYPTTAWNVYTTRAPVPSQITTQTPSGTFSASSMENTVAAAAAPSPADDMAKFLARWKD